MYLNVTRIFTVGYHSFPDKCGQHKCRFNNYKEKIESQNAPETKPSEIGVWCCPSAGSRWQWGPKKCHLPAFKSKFPAFFHKGVPKQKIYTSVIYSSQPEVLTSVRAKNKVEGRKARDRRKRECKSTTYVPVCKVLRVEREMGQVSLARNMRITKTQGLRDPRFTLCCFCQIF